VLDGLNELVGLSKLDSQLAAEELELAALPAARQKAAEERAAGEARLQAADAALAAVEQRQRQAEVRVQDQEALLAKLSQQQHQVKTNEAYTALLSEMERARESISEAETQVLEAMEAIEASRRERDTLRAELRAVGERLEAEERQRSEREAALRAEIASLRSQRVHQVEGVDRTLLTRYERVATRRSPAVAVVTSELCPGCRVGIPPQAYIEIRRAEQLVTCGNCQRILIHRDRLSAGA
jgi:uncharacterized protein